MHRNSIWLIFLILVVAISFWFIFRAGSELIGYFRLSQRLPALIEKWEIKEQNSNQYEVIAEFSFDFQKKIYHGTDRVGGFYPNPWAAEQALNKFSNRSWAVWLNPKKPQKGVLEKAFPVKAAVSASILLGLTIYFFCLGIYAGLKNDEK